MSFFSKIPGTAGHIRQKTAYNLGQNIAYMISLAWGQRRSVILLALTMAAVAILRSLTQLFIVPSILGAVEAKISGEELTVIILLFTGALVLLNAAWSYFSSCSQFGRIEVRLCIGSMIQNKALTMSYPDIEDQNVRRKLDKASMLAASNSAATEAIWTTLMNLLKNAVEFIIYLSLLTMLNPLMIIAVLATTIVSFSVSNYLNGWGYRHRDEESEYSRRINYLSERSRDYTLAKDVRIFGMQGWIEDVYNGTLGLYRSFTARGECVYFRGNIIDVILAFMRNGLVYFFLIQAVLKGEMSAAQFVLYFNTVNVFTGGIGKIMTDLATLWKQSFDISSVREFLDYPETFRMEEGIPITPDLNIPYQIELQNVSFRYPEADKNTLSHINLTIRPGEKLAMLSMDFADMDDGHVQELRSRIWQNTDSGGWGLYKLIYSFDAIIRSVMSITGAVFLTASLFLLPVTAGSGRLTILNHPVFILFIMAVMFSVTFAAPLLSVKANSYWVKYADENQLGNRLFGFWLGNLGNDRSKALDIRIYRQDILSRNNLRKYNPFVPTSKLAGASRGPMGGYRALSGAVSQIFAGVAYVYVCLKALGGAFGVGRIVQYVSAVIALSDGLSKLIEAIGDLKNNTSFLCTVFNFLDMPNKMEQGEMDVSAGTVNQTGGKGCDEADKGYEIEFRNVSFKYPDQQNYALRNVSMTFHAGQRLAVVGMNGSGKTTFIKLLCRLYDPTEGEILLNGVDIRKYNYHEYMQLFSVVFQDFRLLSFELGQNVAGSRNVDLDKADQCLRDAGFGMRLDKLPQGLLTAIYKDFDEKGVDISGGEAQKIALARALYKDAPFIILDEPTAALDPVAEFEVYNRMNQMIGERSAIFISHRLSSCRLCHDQQNHEILVFHEGRLIQRGSHDVLLSDRSGMYYRLWSAQAQYYEVEE